MSEFKLSFKCDFLIDQCRYIGNDPVGHHCNNDAKWESEDGVLMCDRCKEMFLSAPERLTIPPFYGRKYQEKIMKDFLLKMVEQ